MGQHLYFGVVQQSLMVIKSAFRKSVPLAIFSYSADQQPSMARPSARDWICCPMIHNKRSRLLSRSLI